MAELFSGSDIAATAATMSTPDPVPAASADSSSSVTPDASLASTTDAPIEGAAPIAPTEASVAAKPVQEPGPLPFKEHKAALENARIKEAAKVRAEIEQQYAWVKNHQLTEDGVRTMHGVRQQMVTDPGGFMAEYVTHILNSGNPEHVKAVRAIAARVLGTRSQAAPAEDPEPTADLLYDNGDGTQTRLYSAEQQAKREAWARRQWMGDVQQELAPLKQDLRTRAQREADAKEDADAKAYSDSILAKRRTLPGWIEHEPEIKAVFGARSVPNEQVGEALMEAYVQVVLPKLSQTDRAKAIGTLQQKTAASTANPAAMRATTPAKSPTTGRFTAELVEQAYRQAGMT